MAMHTQNIVVVGGGLAGLIQALYIARNSTKRITLVEPQPALGGSFSSIPSPFGPLDHGIHILYETGIAALDDLCYDILGEKGWIVLSGVRKDIAGNFFSGKLNQGSIFPDIRSLPKAEYEAAVANLFSSMRPAVSQFENCESLHDFFLKRFGPFITEKVLRPIVSKIWGIAPEQVSPWAARIVYMTRLVLFGPELALELKKSPFLDLIIAYPDQLSLPSHLLSNSLSGLYPRQFGMSTVVSALTKQLQVAGVNLLTGATVTNLTISNGRVAAIQIKQRDGEELTLDVSHLLWTSLPQTLAKLLGVAAAKLPDPPLQALTVHLFLKSPPSMGSLYYFYCFDSGFHVFRVSNSAAYCSAAVGEFGFPISVELHFPPGQAVSPEQAVATAVSEVQKLGIVSDPSEITHTYAPEALGSFFVPTLSNLAVMRALREGVEAVSPENLSLFSPDITRGMFYLPDVLQATFPRLSAIALE